MSQYYSPEAKILVVEDTKSLRDLTVAMLASLGFEQVTPVADLEAAEVALTQQVFDWILSDMVLEPGTGLDLLRRTKNMPQCVDTRFVMLTGDMSDADESEAMAEGAFAYLKKPVSVPMLQQLLTESSS